MHSKDIEIKLQQAEERIAVGQRYAHYKNPDKPYRVLHVALLEADEEPCVVYQAEFGDQITWVRPLYSFVSDVEVDGNKVARFQKVC